ncbi:unnamed protein product, partial [Iphiclides podalirius]
MQATAVRCRVELIDRSTRWSQLHARRVCIGRSRANRTGWRTQAHGVAVCARAYTIPSPRPPRPPRGPVAPLPELRRIVTSRYAPRAAAPAPPRPGPRTQTRRPLIVAAHS